MPDIHALITESQDSALPQCILDPYTYLESIPGNNKNVRAMFLKAFNDLYYHIENPLVLSSIDEVISIFHNASLLIDDIEDNSSYRRGSPAAHTQYGVPLTINSGNLMYFVALEKAMKLSKLVPPPAIDPDQLAVKIAKILTDEMLFLHHGQGLDIYWRDHKESVAAPPTIDQYLQMIMNKTGGLFRLSVRLLECFAPVQTTASSVPLANLLGIIYQIRDDYLNLVDSTYSHMKGYTGEDLIEGKLSLPILHSLLQNASSSSPVKSVLLMKDRDSLKSNQPLIMECIDFMRNETNSLEYTRNLLKEYQQKAAEMIVEKATVPAEEDPLLLQVVNKLCDV